MANAKSGRKPLLIIITGPTASGKTALAIDVAERFGCEIISADSRQLYGEIPVGTAAPKTEELSHVRHHLIGALKLEDYYSAARFEEDALRLLPDLFEKSGGYAVVCGGSMMYVDALTDGIDLMPTVSDEVRQKVADLYAAHGLEGLLALLEITDPEYFVEVDWSNVKRVMHALEITMAAGKPYSSLRTGQKADREFDILKFALDWPRDQLFDRINRRVDLMMASGFETEARRVYPRRELNSLNTVGFKELFAYFDGAMNYETAVARIKKNTRVYAKKQLTWLKKDPAVIWLKPENAFSDVLDIINDRYGKI